MGWGPRGAVSARHRPGWHGKVGKLPVCWERAPCREPAPCLPLSGLKLPPCPARPGERAPCPWEAT